MNLLDFFLILIIVIAGFTCYYFDNKDIINNIKE